MEALDVTVKYPTDVTFASAVSPFTTFDIHGTKTFRIVGFPSPSVGDMFGLVTIATVKLARASSGALNLTLVDAYLYKQDGGDVSVTKQPTTSTCTKQVCQTSS